MQRAFYLLNVRVLFFFTIGRSVVMMLVFYYKGIDANDPAIYLPMNPVKCSACIVSPKKGAIECGMPFSEIRLFLENHSLEFHEIWCENTLGSE